MPSMKSEIEKLLSSIKELPQLTEEAPQPRFTLTTTDITYLITCVDLGIEAILRRISTTEPRAFLRILGNLIDIHKKLTSAFDSAQKEGML